MSKKLQISEGKFYIRQSTIDLAGKPFAGAAPWFSLIFIPDQCVINGQRPMMGDDALVEVEVTLKEDQNHVQNPID